MGHVHVPADDDRLLLIQGNKIVPESVLPAHAVVDALQPVLGVGGVNTDQIEVFILQRDDPALGVVLRDTDVVADRQRRVPGKDGGAGVALPLGVAPVALISGQIQVDLSRLVLGLLQAEKIRVQVPEDVLKAFFHHSPQAVYIPGNQSHVSFSSVLALTLSA